jgi:hypothetical protein
MMTPRANATLQLGRRTARLYLFTDGCPADWLEAGKDDRWHTVAYLAIPSLPDFERMAAALKSSLPHRRLRRWAGGDSYRSRFKAAFGRVWPEFKPWINAVSFQERVLREGRVSLLANFNDFMAEGRSVGFVEGVDENGRSVLRHEFVNAGGYFKVEAPENKVLVLLLIAWNLASQYWYYRRKAIADGGYDDMELTIVADLLSGDREARQVGLAALHHLIDHDSSFPVTIKFSRKSFPHVADLLVDNLAGWLNECVQDSRALEALRGTVEANEITGWKRLILGPVGLKMLPVLAGQFD